MGWVEDAKDLKFNQGKSWSETARGVAKYFPGMDQVEILEKVRYKLRKSPEYMQSKADCDNGQCEYPKKDEILSDGSRRSYRILELRKNHTYTPEELLKLHWFDPPEDWELIEAKSNVWNGMTGKKRNNELVELWQSTVRVRPKVPGVTMAMIDKYLESKKFREPKPPTKPLQYDPSGEILEIDSPDLHNGLLSWQPETGADYDIRIAEERFKQVMFDIKSRCAGRKLKKITFVTLGDILHVDNDNQTTTKGTPQQVDGRIAKIFNITCDMFIDAFTMLGNIAPLEVVYLPGNHDRVTGYMLLKAISLAFKDDKNITFDTSPNPQKHRLWGNVLVGFVHGDIANKNMGTWLQDRARRDYGLAKFVEVHAGHYHTEKTKERYSAKLHEDTITEDIGGVVIRYLPTISNVSYWEHLGGYPFGTKTMVSYVWNEKTGLRDVWYSNV